MVCICVRLEEIVKEISKEILEKIIGVAVISVASVLCILIDKILEKKEEEE